MFEIVKDRRGTHSLKWDLFGKSVLPFWVADMDFPAPKTVIEALRSRVDHGIFGYTLPGEVHAEAVCAYFKRTHGLRIEGDWLVWLPGLVPALSVACRAAGEATERSRVITSTPVYPPFFSAPTDSGRSISPVPLQWTENSQRYEMDYSRIAEEADRDACMYLLCNPHNPVGQVYARDQVDKLADICREKDLWLCSDEIHCDMILEKNVRHHSALEWMDSIGDRLIVLMAASKTYNIAGLGCAFAVIPDRDARSRFRHAMGGWLPPVNALALEATLAAYNRGEPWRLQLMEYLRSNRDHLYERLSAIAPQVGLRPMQATYLAWLNVEQLGFGNPVNHFKSHGLGFSGGREFGGPGFIRWNFGCPRETLDTGLHRFETALRDL